MVIGVDVRELNGKKAGKGWYVWHIMEELTKIDQENEYWLYTDKEIKACKLPARHRQIVIAKSGFGWHLAVSKSLKNDGVEVYWAPTSLIVPAITQVPTVMTIHDLTVLLFPKMHPLKNRLIEKGFTGRALKKTSRILAISEATKQDLIRLFPKTMNKITVAKLGVTEEFHPMSDQEVEAILKKYGLDRGYILFVGTLEPRKNLVKLVEAYGGLKKAIRDENKLVIAGKKGWFFEEIFARVKELHLENEVEFLGYVPDQDLPGIYNGAKLFVYPSSYEGFGLPVLEAMACGVPVITSNVSSLPEVAEGVGELVDPDDSLALMKLINNSLIDEKKLDRMKNTGLIKAKEFTWQKTAELILNEIEKVY